MSRLSVLVYISKGNKIRKAYSLRYPGDEEYLELFSRILTRQQLSPEELFAALEKGIPLSRGRAFDSVWTFSLDRDVITLTKDIGSCSVPLSIGRERLLTVHDFELKPSSPATTHLPEQSIPGPYSRPRVNPGGRERSLLGKILEDFSHKWRHVLRRDMNSVTFLKLAYATVWLSQLQFTLSERTGFEHVSDGGTYVRLVDLPDWESPQEQVVPTQSSACWFVLLQDMQKGLEMVRNHMTSQEARTCSTSQDVIYTILTVRQVVLCKASSTELVWTQPEKLFDGTPASDNAIDMILWAARISRPTPRRTPMNELPLEIQDRIIHYAAASPVASAKLGCELGLGSGFSWLDQGAKVTIEDNKRHRGEGSPTEPHIILNGAKSGLSYKRERGCGGVYVPSQRTRPPAPG